VAHIESLGGWFVEMAPGHCTPVPLPLGRSPEGATNLEHSRARARATPTPTVTCQALGDALFRYFVGRLIQPKPERQSSRAALPVWRRAGALGACRNTFTTILPP